MYAGGAMGAETFINKWIIGTCNWRAVGTGEYNVHVHVGVH